MFDIYNGNISQNDNTTSGLTYSEILRIKAKLQRPNLSVVNPHNDPNCIVCKAIRGFRTVATGKDDNK